MDNNRWERKLDRYLDFVSSPLEMIDAVKTRWGSILAALFTPLAFVLFLAISLLTSPWGLFLILARILERR